MSDSHDIAVEVDKSKYLLDFIVREYIGCEIIRRSDYERFLQANDREPFRITTRDGIKASDEVVVWPGYSCCAHGIVEKQDKWLVVRTGEHTQHLLEFDGDDRHCWVSTCMCNLKALEKVVFE